MSDKVRPTNTGRDSFLACLYLRGYVLGGISGTDFLVSALGLTQPKAGRGIVLPSVLIHFGEDPTVTTISLVTLAHTIRGLRKRNLYL